LVSNKVNLSSCATSGFPGRAVVWTYCVRHSVGSHWCSNITRRIIWLYQ